MKKSYLFLINLFTLFALAFASTADASRVVYQCPYAFSKGDDGKYFGNNAIVAGEPSICALSDTVGGPCVTYRPDAPTTPPSSDFYSGYETASARMLCSAGDNIPFIYMAVPGKNCSFTVVPPKDQPAFQECRGPGCTLFCDN